MVTTKASDTSPASLSEVASAVAELEADRLLLVDDDEMVRDVVQGLLAREGYEVDVAHCGEEALEFLRSTEYSMVVTDLAMPGMDGIEVIREARKISPDTVSILITGCTIKFHCTTKTISNAIILNSEPELTHTTETFIPVISIIRVKCRNKVFRIYCTTEEFETIIVGCK